MKYLLCLLPLLVGCAAPVWNGGDAARSFIVVADISQVPESDPFVMRDLRVERDSLKFTAGYGGGCRSHEFTLYASRDTSGADEANLYIQHNGNHDVCQDWIEGHAVAFDLRGLKSDLKLGRSASLRFGAGLDSAFALAY